jgi:hypothetical protein
MLLYADDIVLLSSNVFDLQSKIDIIRAYFSENELTINLDKTKIVMFKYGRERKATQLKSCNQQCFGIIILLIL